jgi:hypothetical protein
MQQFENVALEDGQDSRLIGLSEKRSQVVIKAFTTNGLKLTPYSQEGKTMYTEPSETSLANRSALPESWVARIFDHMLGLYGSKFSDLWGGTNLDTVQRIWSQKLAGFREMPGAIKEALNALDGKPYPPTLPEFLALCREAAPRHQNTPVMVGYTPTPEDQARAQEIIKKAAERISGDGRDHKAWAKKLKERHESGELLSLLQVKSYQEALSTKEAA